MVRATLPLPCVCLVGDDVDVEDDGEDNVDEDDDV